MLVRIGLFTLQALLYVTSMFFVTWRKPLEQKPADAVAEQRDPITTQNIAIEHQQQITEVNPMPTDNEFGADPLHT